MVTTPPCIELYLTSDALRAALEHDVRVGLTAEDKWLPPVWFYDERGSALFSEITRLPEYYPTRAERRLLDAHASEIASRAKAETLVELGAGTCDKSRVLLDALRRTGPLRRYVPLDVSEAALAAAAATLAEEYPEVEIRAIVGDFHKHLDRVPADDRRLTAFLGGTVGNLLPEHRHRFFVDLDSTMTYGDTFLLGTDLVKDQARLEAAYNDTAGVTAEFNRNILLVLNRELGAAFDPDSFEHVAKWVEERSWIEMRLRARTDFIVPIRDLGIEVAFAAGEGLLTEISAKFTADTVESELWNAGFVVDEMWDEPGGEFLLTLASPYC